MGSSSLSMIWYLCWHLRGWIRRGGYLRGLGHAFVSLNLCCISSCGASCLLCKICIVGDQVLKFCNWLQFWFDALTDTRQLQLMLGCSVVISFGRSWTWSRCIGGQFSCCGFGFARHEWLRNRMRGKDLFDSYIQVNMKQQCGYSMASRWNPSWIDKPWASSFVHWPSLNKGDDLGSSRLKPNRSRLYQNGQVLEPLKYWPVRLGLIKAWSGQKPVPSGPTATLFCGDCLWDFRLPTQVWTGLRGTLPDADVGVGSGLVIVVVQCITSLHVVR